MKIEVYGAPLDLADDLEDSFVATAKDAVGRAGDLLLKEVVRRISTVGEPIPHGPPRRVTGDLIESFKRIAPRVRGRVATSGIRSSDPGAGRLEYGEVDVRGVQTLPHPYLQPSVEAVEKDVDRLMQATVK